MKTFEEIVKGGAALRKIRESVCLSMREVERRSMIVANLRKNRDYYVSHNYLSNLENGTAYPDFQKLYSLALIYRRSSFLEVVGLFEISIQEAATDDTLLQLPFTSLITPDVPLQDETRKIVAPVDLRPNTSIERTNLISRMFESWTNIPVRLLERLDLRKMLYGYVGTRDKTLFPIIRPGSFVQIDSSQRRIATSWKDESDRPIYFLELRHGYACSWCELEGKQLTILPTVQSGLKSRHLRYPGDAEVLGRVTAVTMRIADFPAIRG
jgi:transcriptional regulator with XRE-family HTH domain